MDRGNVSTLVCWCLGVVIPVTNGLGWDSGLVSGVVEAVVLLFCMVVSAMYPNSFSFLGNDDVIGDGES